MIKLVYCFNRRPELTDAEFLDYWRNAHGPIAAAIPHLKKLVQSRALENPEDSIKQAFDGMAELWFDSWDDLLSARSSPQWSASTADEVNFIDGSGTACFVTEEWEVPLTDR